MLATRLGITTLALYAMSDDPTHDYVPGLAGVPAARSSVCYLDGARGKLQYRGYPVEQLAQHCTYEEVVYLLFFGELPRHAELETFRAELEIARAPKFPVVDVLKSLPSHGHPMDALRVAVSATGMFHTGDHVRDLDFRRRSVVKLVAQLPTLVAAWHRVRNGEEPVPPRMDLSHAGNFLYMLAAEEPPAEVARVMDVALTLHAEHQMNASTFAARVVGSTLAGPFITMSAAIGALSGPLHGGANEEVLTMLRTIPEGATPEQIRSWAEERLARKQKISGFGHREYKVKDPRATILQGLAVDLFDQYGKTPLYDIAVVLEQVMADLVGHKGVYPNVDFYSGIVYEKMGIPTDLFTPVFAIARVAGWLAHLLEQLEDNRIFRPNQIWIGQADRTVVPLAER